MNAVEIEAAITDLAAQPFDPLEFPFAFLQAFGNKETTLKRLRSGDTNKSDIGGVLQSKNIHILVTPEGKVSSGLDSLRANPATTKGKVQFILATDGVSLEAEALESGHTVACAFTDFPDHFGFFLPRFSIRVRNGTTKNDKGCDKPIPPDMVSYFRSLPTESPFLFYRMEAGKYLPLGDFFKSWSKCLRIAGIKDFRFHDTRHMAATALLDNGTPEQVVLTVAGWKTNMIRTYYHRDGKKSLNLVKFGPGSNPEALPFPRCFTPNYSLIRASFEQP